MRCFTLHSIGFLSTGMYIYTLVAGKQGVTRWGSLRYAALVRQQMASFVFYERKLLNK